MKAKLTFREKEPWSGRSIYKNCRHGIQTYLKRSGVITSCETISIASLTGEKLGSSLISKT